MTGSPIGPRDSPSDARFIPGRMLTGRYRIVERVGRGAMGEVYRAEDLKLGQAVALKFLPEEFGRDPARLEAFLTEVRLARQISHPNVCRVYDIEDAGGTPFLTMEFVDGEDLASLLRRIGRLPADKAVEIGREICAGLEAIHDRGVIHRDLKPANVMIDGRGHARISDFGLSAPQDAPVDGDTITGTPAYLAPECLFDGQAPSVRSDLYSLGLVLYEMFTGRRTFDAPTVPELMRQRRDSTPVSPSKLRSDIDPGVERIILRCLERDRERRPMTAHVVAAALPGDPLAIAIAAGETPTTAMVAAATSGAEGLRPAVAWSCLAALLIGLSLVTALSPRTRLVPALPLPEPPDAMAGRARALLHDLGYPVGAADRAYGYRFEGRTVDHIITWDHSATRWNALSRARPPVATFWYRESPADMLPADRWQRVSYTDPPLLIEGMVGVQLDGLGRLRRLDSILSPAMARSTGAAPGIGALFRAAGLDSAEFHAVAPDFQPIVGGDSRLGYAGHYPEAPQVPVRVDAVTLRGRPVSFVVEEPWLRPEDAAADPPDPSERITAAMIGTVRPALFLVAMLLAVWLARRNLRAGRGDTKRAARVAGGLTTLRLLFWLLGGHHTLVDFIQQFNAAFAWGLYDFAYGWICYMAVEPYVRRLWPRTLISWVRALDGQHANSRVGRDVLIGCLLATTLALVVAGHTAAPLLFGAPPGRPDNVGYVENQLATLIGLRYQIAELLWLFRSNLVLIMGFLVTLVAARILLRNATAAVVVAFLIYLPLSLPRGEFVALNFALAFVSTLAVLFVFLRFGLLASAVGVLMHATLQSTPLGMGMGSWPTSRTVLILALVLAIGMYGFVRSMGGRPVFRDVIGAD